MGFDVVLNKIHEVSIITGIQQEQLTFLTSMIIALICAFFYRYFLNSSKVSTNTRLLFVGGVGLWLQYFSWRLFSLLHIFDVTISYLILKYCPRSIAHRINFVWCMGFLVCCHAYLAYTFHLQLRFSTDFTGPIMMMTQRITSIGFNIYDGTMREEEDLTEHQKKVKVKELPTVIEFFSYSFYFCAASCGPLVFYSDFINFMRRTRYNNNNNDNHNNKTVKEPPYMMTVLQKFLITIISVTIFFFSSSLFPFDRNAEESYVATTPWYHRAMFLYISLFICRTKYYFAWSLSDCIHNIAGIGFTGYDKFGNPKWDLLTNLNIKGIEFATNLKTYIDNWNIMTTIWLRSVCYERAPKRIRTFATFLLSAMWHGLLPGYYITFLSGNLFTYAARLIRKFVRPHFLSSGPRKWTYDVVSWITTQFAISYIVLSFMLLRADTSFRFFRSCYFCGHIIAVAIVVFLPRLHNMFVKDDSAFISEKKGTNIHSNGDVSNLSQAKEMQSRKSSNGLRNR